MTGGTGPDCSGAGSGAGSAGAVGSGFSAGSGARRLPTYSVAVSGADSVAAPFWGCTGAVQLLPGAPAGIHWPSAGAGRQPPPSIVGDGCNGGIDGGGGGGAQAETGSGAGCGAGWGSGARSGSAWRGGA
ncbi:hypothetical protein ABH105_24245 [Mycolicibacterium smegmatis]|uniref:hypothetical protein n=1 Tax=Mycolicibacterium smegmatis TaxID=1772 RepID=UPI0032604FA2